MFRFWRAAFGKGERSRRREAAIDEVIRCHDIEAAGQMRSIKKSVTAAQTLIEQLQKDVTQWPR